MTIEADFTGVDFFPEFVNEHSFIDRVVVAVFGSRRRKRTNALFNVRNVPIGSVRSQYARMHEGISRTTGNPVQLKYAKRGKLALVKSVAPNMVVSRSDSRPLTAADVVLSIDAMLRRGHRERISSVEFTFDVQGWTVSRLLSCVRTRALQLRTVKSTAYVGSPHSHWQLRLYRKAPGISRIEFVFRSRFLRRHEINGLAELLKLRRLNIWRLVSFSDSQLQQRLKAMQMRLVW